ncbi:MAG: hypothetical protein J4F28_01955 [Nitrosopumilaceae archaeon]|nr:hypothetical protein [Nitrosopumilaceae archaeon]
MGRLETDETILTLAVSRSNSLRTTVPRHIIKKLNLSKGDAVRWDFDKTPDGKWIATMSKKSEGTT